ncbi:hypothetical protein C8J57DRAFT_1275057 [Mycena rebaudengoi]|nr:hypothetical protein C8J57DRAFT_1275057 [Mycena rebaudengoi]
MRLFSGGIILALFFAASATVQVQCRRSRLVTRAVLADAVATPVAPTRPPNGRCPVDSIACPRRVKEEGVPPAIECVDITSDFRSCGGCRFPAAGQMEGQDCTRIPNVASASCQCGVCIIQRCRPGYALDVSETFCERQAVIDRSQPDRGNSFWLAWLAL